jgi:translation initiation factor IF-2
LTPPHGRSGLLKGRTCTAGGGGCGNSAGAATCAGRTNGAGAGSGCPLELEPEVMAEVSAEEPALVIENIRAEKLEGPKILGKIQLPVDSDTRPKIDEKRKRKRIPIEKPGVPQAFQRGPGAGQQRPGQQATPGQGGGGRFQPRPAGQPGTQTGQGGGGRFQVGKNTGGAGGNRFGGGNRTGGGRTDDKQIDEKEIQRKIQETQAKLSGGSGRGGRNLKKLRRDKRNEMAEAADGMEDNKLQVTEFISVSELANLMDVSFAEVIGKCMGLGIMVSINQRLDAEVIELVASEFGFDVEFIDMEKQMEMDEEDEDEERRNWSSARRSLPSWAT